MLALGKKNLNIYLGNFFAEGYHAGPRQSLFFLFFLENSLSRALTIALGKDLFSIFSDKFCAEGYGYGQGPRQRLDYCLFLEFLCRGLWSRPSAKTREILNFFCLFIYIQTKDRYIYIYIPSHTVHNEHIHLTNITYIYHEHNVCTSSSPQVHQIEPKFQTADTYAP